MIAGSNLEKILAGEKFAVTGELGPPRGADLNEFVRLGNALRNHVDAFNITDNQTAIVHASSIVDCKYK